MKRNVILMLVFLPYFWFAYTLNVNPPEDELDLGNRGVVNKEELLEIVFNSLRMNDFEMLKNYIPNDAEIDYLEKQTSKKNKYIFEEMDAEMLEGNTKLNFEKVLQEGISQELNWSDSEMIDSKMELANKADKRIEKGMFSIQNGTGRALMISFDIIKVKDKWFLFQGIRVEKNITKKASVY